jgi:hypothetical protein
MNKQKWDNENIENLPRLLALIFTLWSLQKPEQMQKQQKSRMKLDKEVKEELKDSENKNLELLSYLNQPHPAQIIGIMRILGVGYSPDNCVNSEKGVILSSLDKIFGINHSKFRNNII